MKEQPKTIKAALITVIFSVVSLLFGSSVNILAPTNGGLGLLFGFLLTLIIIIAPIYYVTSTSVKVRNPKPLFIEPSPWVSIPLFFIASALLFLVLTIILAIPPLDSIAAELGKDTFLGNAAMMVILFTSFFGPITLFFVYTRTRYKRVIEYNTTEWKRIKATGSSK